MGGRRISKGSRQASQAAAAAALAARYDAVRPRMPQFVEQVLGAPWALVSPASRLSDFDSIVPRATLRERVRRVYGVETRPLPDDLVVTLLEAAAARERAASCATSRPRPPARE